MPTKQEFADREEHRRLTNENKILHSENARLKYELERAVERLRVVREHLDPEYRLNRVVRLLEADRAGVA